MASKKIKTKSLRSLGRLLLCVAMVIACVFMLKSISSDVTETRLIKAELKEAQDELKRLEEERDLLTNQVNKLTDPNYASAIARGVHLVVKENEQVFTLPPNPTDK